MKKPIKPAMCRTKDSDVRGWTERKLEEVAGTPRNRSRKVEESVQGGTVDESVGCPDYYKN